MCRIDPNNHVAREGLSRLDPATNRSAVHETNQASSFELVDEVEIEDEDEEHDVSGCCSMFIQCEILTNRQRGYLRLEAPAEH
jgi:hypothetical protein